MRACLQTVKAFIDQIQGVEAEFFEYPGEAHAFMNSGNADIKERMASMHPATHLSCHSCDHVTVLTLKYCSRAFINAQ